MSPAAWIIGALVGGITCTGLGWRLGIDHMKAKALDAATVRAETIEAAQQGAAKAISSMEVKNVTIRQAVQREIIEREVFRDCRSGPIAVGLLNAAAGHEPTASSPSGGQLPAGTAEAGE